MTQAESNTIQQVIRTELLNGIETDRIERLVEDKYYLPKEAIKILISQVKAAL